MCCFYHLLLIIMSHFNVKPWGLDIFYTFREVILVLIVLCVTFIILELLPFHNMCSVVILYLLQPSQSLNIKRNVRWRVTVSCLNGPTGEAAVKHAIRYY